MILLLMKMLEKKYSQRKRAVCDYNSTIDSKFIHIQKIFSVADTYEQFLEFYFPMQYDFRLRIYCVPEGLNYQECDLAKGLLLFKNGKPIEGIGAVKANDTWC